MHVLVKLLTDLRTIVRGDSWWGTPLGSSQLWGKHVRTIDRIGAIASSIRHAEVCTTHYKFHNNDGPYYLIPTFACHL